MAWPLFIFATILGAAALSGQVGGAGCRPGRAPGQAPKSPAL
jgi:hypothetical protein